MLSRMIIYFVLLFRVLPAGIKAMSHKPSFPINLVNHTQAPGDRSIGRMQKPMEVSHGQFKSKYECLSTNEEGAKLVSLVQARFIDKGINDSSEEPEMEAPSAKFSIFNLLTDNADNEEGEEEEEDEDEDVDGNPKEDDDDGSDDDSDYDEFNFFGSEEIKTDKVEGTKGSFLKQYHRQPFRMHHFVFPLLLAYKLKFFTVIPLLLGSLVLLVGTTGVAGFFFALFAAALAIASKSHGH